MTPITALDLVNSNATLPANMLVKNLMDWFKVNAQIEYATIIDQDRICGLVSRDAVNARIAGNKFGYSVMAEKPITRVMIEDPLIVESTMLATDLVKQLIQQRGNSNRFYEDIIVHDKGGFAGLASVKKLIVRQMDIILEQVRAMERSEQILAQKNKELFEASMRLETGQAQFQNFFEKCSIPMIVFERGGNALRANARFLRLTGYTPETLPALGHSNRIFINNGYQTMLARHAASKSELGVYKPTYTLSLLKDNGDRAGVEVSFNVDENNGQIIVSVLRMVSNEELAVDEHVQRRVAGTSNALARSVAENLIDKERDLETAMQKIDAVFSLADRIEKKMEPQTGSDAGRNAAQNLSGDLGQFSIVDLAQVLVLGRKTGELTITLPDGDKGVVFFDTGLIVHALFEGQRGRSALAQIVGIESGNFLFSFDTVAPERSIEGGDPMGVLLAACANMDEESEFNDEHLAAA